jgi:hypothetical protein
LSEQQTGVFGASVPNSVIGGWKWDQAVRNTKLELIEANLGLAHNQVSQIWRGSEENTLEGDSQEGIA